MMKYLLLGYRWFGTVNQICTCLQLYCKCAYYKLLIESCGSGWDCWLPNKTSWFRFLFLTLGTRYLKFEMRQRVEENDEDVHAYVLWRAEESFRFVVSIQHYPHPAYKFESLLWNRLLRISSWRCSNFSTIRIPFIPPCAMPRSSWHWAQTGTPGNRSR